MKKNTVIDIKLNTDSVGFQIRESYKKARTNIIYSIVKKVARRLRLQVQQNLRVKRLPL